MNARRRVTTLVRRIKATHAAVAFIVGGLLFTSTVTASGRSLAQLSQCNQVAFIGAAGSGQYYNQEWDISISPQLVQTYDGFMERIGNRRTVGVHMIDYPALSVDVLGRDLASHWAYPLPTLRRNIHDYLAGKDQGVSALWSKFNTIRSTCPNERIVLAGYSQGAMVVHQFLEGLNRHNDPGGKAAIRGVVLVADPDRTKFSDVVDFGTASYNSYGVCDAISLFVKCTAPEPLTDIPSRFRSITIGVCQRDDLVCDTSAVLSDLWRTPDKVGLVNRARAIHSSYSTLRQTATAGRGVANYVLR